MPIVLHSPLFDISSDKLRVSSLHLRICMESCHSTSQLFFVLFLPLLEVCEPLLFDCPDLVFLVYRAEASKVEVRRLLVDVPFLPWLWNNYSQKLISQVCLLLLLLQAYIQVQWPCLLPIMFQPYCQNMRYR